VVADGRLFIGGVRQFQELQIFLVYGGSMVKGGNEQWLEVEESANSRAPCVSEMEGRIRCRGQLGLMGCGREKREAGPREQEKKNKADWAEFLERFRPKRKLEVLEFICRKKRYPNFKSKTNSNLDLEIKLQKDPNASMVVFMQVFGIPKII
jgi:hypothetical protein